MKLPKTFTPRLIRLLNAECKHCDASCIGWCERCWRRVKGQEKE